MAIHSPLELYYWFVTVLSGDITIFIALAFIAIAAFSAMFRMPNIIMFICFGVFIIMLSVYLQALYILILLVAGLGIGWVITRIWKT